VKTEQAGRTVLVAWLVTAVYYFYQYTMRSAPAVMMPQLAAGFSLDAAAVASLVGVFYYGYSPFSFYVLGLVTGIASGAAMRPYAVIKEANPPEVSGTGTGVVSFLNFTFSALLGPVFAGRLLDAGAGAERFDHLAYQQTFGPLLYGVALAIVLTLLLVETGPAARWIAVPVEISA
jgi:hypothetical protein